MTVAPDETVTWPDPRVVGTLRAVSDSCPLVHCLTNIVVAGFSANVLLALGASPAMVENDEEAAPFAAMSAGVLVNLGTLSQERERAMRRAAVSAHDHDVPWVLDPVAVGALAHRTELAVELLGAAPTIVRGNGSEIQALAAASGATGVAGGGGRGVDSLATSDDALAAAGDLARARRCAVAVSGEVDYLTDGERTVAVPGGSPLMTQVTGVGCALGALMAAGAAVADDPLTAAVAASAVFGAAGEQAAIGTAGPGSFAVSFVDHLASLAETAAAG